MNQLCMGDQYLSEDILLETHRKLTHDIEFTDGEPGNRNGRYRADAIEGSTCTAKPGMIPFLKKKLVLELKADLKRRESCIDPIALASKFAYVFANIHPFAHGNGEICRLILNSLLFKYGSYLVCLGQFEEDRSIYADVINKSSVLGEMYWDAGEHKTDPHKWLAAFVQRNVKDYLNELSKAMGYGVVEI